MAEKHLKIYKEDKTFFSKLSNSLSKLLIPTKLGFNSVMISMKRSNMLKAFTASQEEKYEDCYSLYLESIDRYIMDSVYKKVKKGIASEFEVNAMSKYYTIVNLKESEYIEYKYQKQKYLIELDYQTVLASDKFKLIETYKEFYVDKMDFLYKGLLKHYSVQLADTLNGNKGQKELTYDKVFIALNEYIENILPHKLKKDKKDEYKEIIESYDILTKYKEENLTKLEYIEKSMILLGISRNLFAHSLPLIAAEQCYIQLIKELRKLTSRGSKEAYKMLIRLIEDYNVKLLSTKVYWDNDSIREEYKQFWDKLKEIEKLKEKNETVYNKLKETLFIKYDLMLLDRSKNNYNDIKKFYKRKLVEFGVMRKLKNKCKTGGPYAKHRIVVEKPKAKPRAKKTTTKTSKTTTKKVLPKRSTKKES